EGCRIINDGRSIPIGFITHSAKSQLKNITGILVIPDNNGNDKKIKLTSEILNKWIPDQEFEKVPYIDLSDVKWNKKQDFSKDKYKIGEPTIHRRPAYFALFANKGDNVKLEFYYGQISKNYKDMNILILSPKGKTVYEKK